MTTKPIRYVPCFMKRLPTHQWIEGVKQARALDSRNAPASLVPESVPVAERATLDIRTYWGKQGVDLSVGFLESATPALRAKILSHMNAWGEWANVRFRETTAAVGTADVRIAFGASGYWSYLGTDIRQIAAGEPTMNLQDFSLNTPDSEFYRVVRHETGHTLGFPHEHMRREIISLLDAEKTYAYFAKDQGWSRDEVKAQVLTPLEDKAMIETPADKISIMCYALPAEITRNGVGIPGGLDIDPVDGKFAAKIYPKP